MKKKLKKLFKKNQKQKNIFENKKIIKTIFVKNKIINYIIKKMIKKFFIIIFFIFNWLWF